MLSFDGRSGAFTRADCRIPFFLRPLIVVLSIMPKAIPAMAAPISSSHAEAPVAPTMKVISLTPPSLPGHQPGRACSPSSARASVTSSFTSRMPL